MDDDPIHHIGKIRWKAIVGLEERYWVALA